MGLVFVIVLAGAGLFEIGIRIKDRFFPKKITPRQRMLAGTDWEDDDYVDY